MVKLIDVEDLIRVQVSEFPILSYLQMLEYEILVLLKLVSVDVSFLTEMLLMHFCVLIHRLIFRIDLIKTLKNNYYRRARSIYK